jgi:hypothetical protein
MYAEWKAGRRPDLAVIEPTWTFGSNDLSFEGEKRFDRWTAGLDEALGAWMEGEGLDRPVTAWFPFRAAKPSVAPDLVEHLARRATRAAAAPDAGRGRRAVWLGGRLVAEGTADGGTTRFAWSYRNRLHRIALEPSRARALRAALAATAPFPMDELLAAVDAAGGEPFETTKEFRALRRAGLAAV